MNPQTWFCRSQRKQRVRSRPFISVLLGLVAPVGLAFGLCVSRFRYSEQLSFHKRAVLPKTEAICCVLVLDPLNLITSDALLIAVAQGERTRWLKAIAAAGIPVVVIGGVRPPSEGITLVTKGIEEPHTVPVRDEIARTFERG